MGMSCGQRGHTALDAGTAAGAAPAGGFSPGRLSASGAATGSLAPQAAAICCGVLGFLWRWVRGADPEEALDAGQALTVLGHLNAHIGYLRSQFFFDADDLRSESVFEAGDLCSQFGFQAGDFGSQFGFYAGDLGL